MGHHSTIALILGCFLVQDAINNYAQAEEPQRTQILQHIRNLGSDSFREREQSQQQLLKIGSPAISALQQAATTPDPEVRWRVRQLLSQLVPKVFYTISQDGILFRLTVSPEECLSQKITKLGPPFDQPQVCVEGLAMSPRGKLYASVVFRTDHQEQSRLYQIDPQTARSTVVGEILPTEIQGLDFGPDGSLYGVIASCRHSETTSQTQLIQIDPQTGRATDTRTQVAHGQLQGLAINHRSQAIVSNGGCGLLSVQVLSQSRTTKFLTGERFYLTMGGHAHLVGLCYGQQNHLFGIHHQDHHSLVQLNLQTGTFHKIAKLNFATNNLAQARGLSSIPSPAVAEKPRTKVIP